MKRWTDENLDKTLVPFRPDPERERELIELVNDIREHKPCVDFTDNTMDVIAAVREYDAKHGRQA